MKPKTKRVLKYAALSLAALIVAGAAAFVLVVGPWPVYARSAFQEQGYYRDTLARIDAGLARSGLTPEPGRLRAGWAEREMTPPPGTPLAGYSGRPNGKRSTGAHDPVFARAIVLGDGADTVALVGADMLMTTLNIARLVWDEVGRSTPLTPDDILFTTSHTHCGPGGFAPGLLAEFSMGAYDPAVERLIAGAISGAVVEAYAAMAPAGLAHGSVDAPEWVENRTGVPGVDAALRYLVLRKESGETCYAVRYSAHPTVLPETFLEISAEYPGALCRALAKETGAMTVFIGGAVGAMGPVAREGDTPPERTRRMGEALARRLLDEMEPPVFEDRLDIASVGAEVGMPPMQARPYSARWRLSPWLAHVVGLPPEGWVQALRVGPLVFLGLPHDSGGAIAAAWADAAAARGVHLWVSSHCVAYCGYLSPDAYYLREPEGYDQFYEWRLMNWFGPDQEALYAALKDHILARLFPGS